MQSRLALNSPWSPGCSQTHGDSALSGSFLIEFWAYGHVSPHPTEDQYMFCFVLLCYIKGNETSRPHVCQADAVLQNYVPSPEHLIFEEFLTLLTQVDKEPGELLFSFCVPVLFFFFILFFSFMSFLFLAGVLWFGPVWPLFSFGFCASFCFGDKVWFCTSGWPWTCSNLPPASASVLGSHSEPPNPASYSLFLTLLVQSNCLPCLCLCLSVCVCLSF